MTEQAGPATGGPGIADQRRGQMLQAALEVISERGFADTRIADVAERIGISPALVIYYFKTKDQLLTESIRNYEDSWYADSKHRMAALPIDARREVGRALAGGDRLAGGHRSGGGGVRLHRPRAVRDFPVRLARRADRPDRSR